MILMSDCALFLNHLSPGGGAGEKKFLPCRWQDDHEKGRLHLLYLQQGFSAALVPCHGTIGVSSLIQPLVKHLPVLKNCSPILLIDLFGMEGFYPLQYIPDHLRWLNSIDVWNALPGWCILSKAVSDRFAQLPSGWETEKIPTKNQPIPWNQIITKYPPLNTGPILG